MDYNDLINIKDFKKKEDFIKERGEISFYCKDCEEIVEVEKKSKNSIIFTCKKCGGTNIAIGTLEGLKENYKIK